VTDQTRLAAARDVLRTRFDEQQQALADYFGLERKAKRLRDELSRLETRMRMALGRLARTTDPATAARLTGALLSQARAAVAKESAATGEPAVESVRTTTPSEVGAR
jgi:hypothetical protein